MIAHGLLCLLTFLTVILFQYGFLCVAHHRQGRRLMAAAGAGGLVSFALLQLLLKGTPGRLSAIYAALPTALLFAAALLLAYQSKKHSMGRIEASSVKDSVDGMPIGICCYWPGGPVKLVNERMGYLSYSVTGGAPLNGESLWRTLERGEGTGEYLQTGENPVVRLSDGRVWSIRREDVEMEGGTLYELIAVDLTDEYAANARLTEKHERVEAFNRRLRALSREIECMTVEKEVLAAKVSIHDNLNRALLYAKRHYLKQDPIDREELLRVWSEAICFAKEEGPEHWRDLYAHANQVAGELGITLSVDGPLPRRGEARALFADAMIACLCNAVRHGGADKVFVTAHETADLHTLRVSNNGSVPENEVIETGGLKNLRERVERAGGTMRLEIAPAFVLTVMLPKTVNGDTFGSYAVGASVTVTADAAADGKMFKEWTAEGVTLSSTQKTAESLTFTMPANAVTLTPVYAVHPNAVWFNVNGSTLTFYHSDTATEGEERKFVSSFSSARYRPWNDDSANITTVKFEVDDGDKIMPTSMAYWFSGFSNLTNIEGIGKLDTSMVGNMSFMFDNCTSLETLDGLSGLDTSNVSSMRCMFRKCSGLRSLNLSRFNTSNVTSMNSMFEECTNLETLDGLSSFNTSLVTDMSSMFYKCSKLKTLDVSRFVTSNVTSMNNTFNRCSGLTSLDLSSFDTSKVWNTVGMFASCTSLTTIYASGTFNTESVTLSTDMFSNCRALVGGNNTGYDSSHTDVAYARIDTAAAPGYFTAKTP